MRLHAPRPHAAYLASAVLLVLITWVDFSTGYELGLFVFYFAPVGLAAWFGTRRAGIVAALAAAACWYASDLLSHHPYSNTLFVYWETLMRLVSFLTTGLTLSAIRRGVAEQEDLLRVVSHDLRAPLAALQGQAQLLRRHAKDDFAAGRADAILRAAQGMDAMIGDLVDGVRARARRLRLEQQPVALHPWLADLMARMAGALEVERVRLPEPHTPPLVVQADPLRLERIVVNLVSNALKYSPAGTPVRLEVRRAGARVAVSVHDEGPGIPDDEVAHLFERFHRGRAAEARAGVGLGLFSTRLLVEAHGGRLVLERPASGGSVFRFDLPAAPPAS